MASDNHESTMEGQSHSEVLPSSEQENEQGEEKASFVYEQLEAQQIRLLSLYTGDGDRNIHLQLETVIHGEAKSYDALSYAWNGETPSISVLCNGQRVLITPSLHGALDMLATQSWPRQVWVDAICINQQDEAEKAVQVPLMGQIYSQAHTVAVWLGPAGEHTDLGIDSFSTLKDVLDSLSDSVRFPGRDQRIPPKTDPVWDAFREVCMRPWFSRLWTLQEVVLAKTAVAVCGSKSFIYQDFIALGRAISRTEVTQGMVTGHDTDDVARFEAGFIPSMTPELYNKFRSWGIWPPLYHLISESRRRRVTEPVDRIYALLGLTNSDVRGSIIVDYSPKNRQEYWRLYVQAAHVMMKEPGGFRWLILTSSKIRLPQLPSWCPNFNSDVKESPLPLRRVRFDGTPVEDIRSPPITSSSNGLRIDLRGCIVDRVTGCLSSTYPSWHSDASQQRGTLGDAARTLSWLSDCQTFAHKVFEDTDKAESVLLRTLVADRLLNGAKLSPAPAVEELKTAFAEMIRMLEALRDGKPWLIKTYEQADQQMSYSNAVFFVCRDRRVFSTSEGRLGIGPDSAQEGDLVCLFQECDLLLLLRPSPMDDTFHLVGGETYVHGIMEGELFDETGKLRKESPMRTFTLS